MILSCEAAWFRILRQLANPFCISIAENVKGTLNQNIYGLDDRNNNFSRNGSASQFPRNRHTSNQLARAFFGTNPWKTTNLLRCWPHAEPCEGHHPRIEKKSLWPLDLKIGSGSPLSGFPLNTQLFSISYGSNTYRLPPVLIGFFSATGERR